MSMSIPWHDDTVVCFEPQKVMWRVKEWFPDSELDYTDYGEEKRQREKKFFSEQDIPEERLKSLLWQCDDNYRANSPSYRFQIPCDDGFGPIQGVSRRLVVSVVREVAPPKATQDRIEEFLRTFEIGTFECWYDDESSN